MLLDSPSGDLFGLSQNVGMGWAPSRLLGKQILILGTQGGIRHENGAPIALGYHTGHWEIGLLMKEAAEEIRRQGGVPLPDSLVTHVMAVPKEQLVCLIPCRFETTQRLFIEG